MKIIDKGVAKLKRNQEAGKRILKRLIPREYVVKYGVTNLWKLNLDKIVGWTKIKAEIMKQGIPI